MHYDICRAYTLAHYNIIITINRTNTVTISNAWTTDEFYYVKRCMWAREQNHKLIPRLSQRVYIPDVIRLRDCIAEHRSNSRQFVLVCISSLSIPIYIYSVRCGFAPVRAACLARFNTMHLIGFTTMQCDGIRCITVVTGESIWMRGDAMRTRW